MSERVRFEDWEAAHQAGWDAHARIVEQEKRELVEAAYKEGYRDGTGCCDYGMVVDDDEHRDWLESNAYKALTKHEKEQGEKE